MDVKIRGRLILTALIAAILGGAVQAEAGKKEPVPINSDLEEGDIVEFGALRKEDGERGDRIRWLVLDVDRDENKALMISEECVLCMPYKRAQSLEGNEDLSTTWENSDVRMQLNYGFYDNSFDDGEKDKILQTEVDTADNREFDTEGGAVTHDQVFLLSEEEALEYFSDKYHRRTGGISDILPEEEDRKPGELFISELTDAAFWWLRTPGVEEDCVLAVGTEGTISVSGYLVSRVDFGVRPAMWIRIT